MTENNTSQLNIPQNKKAAKKAAAAQLISNERTELVNTLHHVDPTAPTLCEGWQARHLVAHLILRETSPLTAAGVIGGPLEQRTNLKTNELADSLTEKLRYEQAIERFAHLPGYLKMRHRFPSADRKMNLIEYFVHIEDVRRAGGQHEPRELSREVQEAIWSDVRSRAKLMAGKNYPHGLVLEAPGYVDMTCTVVKPKDNIPATILSGEPAELALYLFGREEVAQVSVS